jgi:hypothetical protein
MALDMCREVRRQASVDRNRERLAPVVVVDPMKGVFTALGFVALLVVGVISIYRLNFYYIHVRYRLTVEVRDGDQTKTGSSVIDVSYNIEPEWSPSGPSTHLSRYVGYAPSVDLGEKGMLFLTFANASRTPDQIRASNARFFCPKDDLWCLPFAAYGRAGTGISTARDKRRAVLEELLRQKGPRNVPFEVLPELMTFRDADGQHQYVLLRPENLGAAFGPNVELKRVVLELTDDPVTPLPESWPQWLKQRGQMEGVLKGYNND